MWQIINKEAQKKNIKWTGNGTEIWVKNVTNPRDIAELFSSYFAEIAEKFIKQNDKNKSLCQM
jgi:hypothetical protein